MSPKIEFPTPSLQFPSEFRTLVEDLRAILWEVDCTGNRFTWISRHAEEVLGYPVAEWLEQPGFWENHMHPGDRESVLKSCQRVEAGGQDHQFEYRMIAANGRIVWLRQIVRVVKNSRGQPIKLRGVMVDITERRDAEKALRDSEEQFRGVFQEAPIAMRLIGRDFRVKAVNHAFCSLVGREERELRNQMAAEFIHPDDRTAYVELVEQLFAGRIPSYKAQYRYINARGETIWVEIFGTLVRDSSGNAVYGLGIAVDITEHKRAEQSLQELSARLMRLQEEERRRIARELHDSTGQNLAALKLNLSRLNCAQLGPEMARAVNESLNITDSVLAEIRTLSHLLHPPLLDELGLACAIRTFIEGFRERSGIVVHLDIGDNLGRHTPELETAIFRIIQEGLTNFYRHSGGTQCWIEIRPEGETLHLELRDDGVGLRVEPLEDIERTAPVFGVGLSGMRERARQLGGHLDIESGGAGWMVRAVFPAIRC